MNNKGADQTVWMCRLVCAFVVRKHQRQVFSRRGPYESNQELDSNFKIVKWNLVKWNLDGEKKWFHFIYVYVSTAFLIKIHYVTIMDLFEFIFDLVYILLMI